jgi:plastocyanin
MRKLFLTALLALALTAALAGAAQAATVKVGDNFFSPGGKTVSAGTKVKFKWVGRHKHNVVKVSGPGGRLASGVTDDSGVNLAKRFGRRGTYKFICTIHPTEMRFTLKVR